MRRTTVLKPSARPAARRSRVDRDVVDRVPERPEVRADVRRLWWPDE